MQNLVLMRGSNTDLHCIICSLDYLSYEAESVGMMAVSAIIRSAIIKIKLINNDV